MKRKRSRLVVGSIVALGLVVLAGKQTGCGGPEGRVASHLQALTKLLQRNLNRPARGVTKVFDYLQENLPELLEQTGELMAALDRIEKEKRRDRRADRMVKRLRQPVRDYAEASDAFFRRVEGDPKARAALEERLSRQRRLGDIFQGLRALLGVAAR